MTRRLGVFVGGVCFAWSLFPAVSDAQAVSERSRSPEGSSAKLTVVETRYVEPVSPWPNGYAESLHSWLRDECLATEVFERLTAAQRLTAARRGDFNRVWPHSSLGYVTPAEFADRFAVGVTIEA